MNHLHALCKANPMTAWSREEPWSHVKSRDLRWTAVISSEKPWSQVKSRALTWRAVISCEESWSHVKSRDLMWEGRAVISREESWSHVKSRDLKWRAAISREEPWSHVKSRDLMWRAVISCEKEEPWSHVKSRDLTWRVVISREEPWSHVKSLLPLCLHHEGLLVTQSWFCGFDVSYTFFSDSRTSPPPLLTVVFWFNRKRPALSLSSGMLRRWMDTPPVPSSSGRYQPGLLSGANKNKKVPSLKKNISLNCFY